MCFSTAPQLEKLHVLDTRRSSKGFLILLVKLLIFLIFAVYGIWDDLGAWKILLRYVPMICIQFWEFSKMIQNREVSTFFCSSWILPQTANQSSAQLVYPRLDLINIDEF